MKKIIIFIIPIILIVLLSFTVSSIAICPSPFDKAKAIALKVQMDSMGRHILNMTINKDGEEITYIIGYIPYLGFIGIGKLQGIKHAIYEYNEKTNKYTIYQNNIREPISSEFCIREAYLIFREMVMEGVI